VSFSPVSLFSPSLLAQGLNVYNNVAHQARTISQPGAQIDPSLGHQNP
jgi:hypothetical protein